jgi:hypothetical protein
MITETLPGLDERPITDEDVRPIRSVLEHIKEDGPIASLAKNVVWWMAAFDMFKKMERRSGLPTSTESRILYGAIVAALKSSGKLSILIADKNPQVLQLLELSKADIESRVKELCWDDDWVENPINAEDKKKLELAFG